MQVNVECFRLSRQQERLWLLQRDSFAYRSQCALLIEGHLEAEVLREALRRVIDRHEILRTAFQRRPGLELPLQIMVESDSPSWQHSDLSNSTSQEQEARIDEIFHHEGQLGFDFEHDRLLRLHLLTLSSRRHALIMTLPSLCADKQTIRNLIDELSRCYRPLLQGEELSSEPQQYADFSEWENELLEGQDAEIGQEFWRQQDFSAGSTMSLPFEVRPLTDSKFEPECIKAIIGPELATLIEPVAARYQTSAANLLLACWQTLWFRLTGRAEITIGNLCDGRRNEELNGAFGLFAKWLPIRCCFDEGLQFAEILTQIDRTTRDADEWQEYFTWERNAGAARNGRGAAFFAIGFEYEEGLRTYREKGLTFSTFKQYVCFDRFKVKLCCSERDDTLLTEFHYDPELIKAEAIRCLMGQFTTLLESVLSNPQARLDELEILSAGERRKLLVHLNETKKEYSLNSCIHELFEEQAARTPDETAVVCEGQQLSYRELNARANQLGHYLIGLGVGPEVLVALCMERSLEMVVGMLGILKAGGAYVPLDLAQPKERLGYMLEDARPLVILTQSPLAEYLTAQKARVVCLDVDWSEIARESPENTESRATAENLLYVIFTSGSTGKPKGVAIEHRQLINYVMAVDERLEFPTGSSYATVSTFAADLGHTMIFPSLCLGGCLHVITHERASDPAALAGYFSQHPIDCLKIVPSHLTSLLMSSHPEHILPRQRLVLGGEASRWEIIETVLKLAPDCRVYNHYGPTETTVGVLTYRVAQGDESNPNPELVPLGRPLANTEIYLLDGNLRPVPQGALGEVYVGGDGLARAYLVAPKLTAEKFIPNPFSLQPGTRLYRTGDLARHRTDGQIEFAGRVDNQIKFHGFRVELNEIRTALNKHPQIRDSVITLIREENGNAVLVAYYAARQELEAVQLREFLSESIVAETIPNLFIHLKKLPLTLNGKINYQALPDPSTVQPKANRVLVMARTPVEQTLTDIWSQVLRVEKVGIHDNFFELGGDSILCIQIIGKANQAGLRFNAHQLFQHQTIAELAEIASTMDLIPAEQGIVMGQVPLTPIQRWFFDKDLPEPHHWNQAMMLELRQPLEAELLEQALQALIVHHDALRLRFALGEDGWSQAHVEGQEAVVFLSQADLSHLSEAERAIAVKDKMTGLQSSLNLSDGPLMRACLFDFGPEQAGQLHIIVHHLLVDVVSWRILLEGLQTAYRQLSRGEAIELPLKTTSFKKWAEMLTEYAGSEALKQESAYWVQQTCADIQRLPADYPAGVNTEATAGTVTVMLTVEETQSLLQDIPAAYHTQINDVLLTALVLSLSSWSGSRAFLIDMEGHGREEIVAGTDLSRTVGWFTTHFPVLLDLGTASHPGEALNLVKEQLRAIPNRGIGYGVLSYLSHDIQLIEQLSSPPPEVSFNHLGQLDQFLAESPLFRVTREFDGSIRSPRGNRSHLLEINSAVISGRLNIVWIYGEQVHRRTTIEHLSSGFTEALRSLLNSDPVAEAAGYTLSDFPLAELNAQELGKLSLMIDGLDENEGTIN